MQMISQLLYSYMSQCMRIPTMWYVRPAKPQISLCKSLKYSMIFKLLTEHLLKFLSLKEGCRGSSESTHVKMPHCWKSHALAQSWFCFRCEIYQRLSEGTPLTDISTSRWLFWNIKTSLHTLAEHALAATSRYRNNLR